MGSPDFALPSLEALLEAGFDIPLVLSQPDRPAGRGRLLRSTAVSGFARERGLPLRTPESLRDPQLHEELRGLSPELFVVVAYRILPGRMFRIPRRGAVNLHASLLPAYRGAAPIQRALMDGCTRTGLTTFLIEKGVDKGMILLQRELSIEPAEDAGSLHDRLAQEGAPLLVETIRELLADRLEGRHQPEGDWPTAPKLDAAARRIRWADMAEQIHNLVRALSPAPGALCGFRGRSVKILRTELPTDPRLDFRSPAPDEEPGRLLAEEHQVLKVACGSGTLEVLRLAPEGGRPLSAGNWLRGARLQPGECFEVLEP